MKLHLCVEWYWLNSGATVNLKGEDPYFLTVCRSLQKKQRKINQTSTIMDLVSPGSRTPTFQVWIFSSAISYRSTLFNCIIDLLISITQSMHFKEYKTSCERVLGLHWLTCSLTELTGWANKNEIINSATMYILVLCYLEEAFRTEGMFTCGSNRLLCLCVGKALSRASLHVSKMFLSTYWALRLLLRRSTKLSYS